MSEPRKAGRPKKETKRDTQIVTLVSADEKAVITEAAEQSGLDTGAYARSLLLVESRRRLREMSE